MTKLKITIVPLFVLIALTAISLTCFKLDRKKTIQSHSVSGGPSEDLFGDPDGRAAWEFDRLKDPVTGKIPEKINILEMEFARTLPNDLVKHSKSLSWIRRGPYNVGGRTRGIEMDVNNSNRILAGGINGGIWETTSSGTTWTKITKSTQLHSVTCLVQDKRNNKTNNWYYGTGEAYGASASSTGAFFLGNGIYKSTDNGATWDSLHHTSMNIPQSFTKDWDLVWNIVVDNSIDSLDVVYAACYGTLYKSTNGGTNWDSVIFTSSSSKSYFTDVAVTSTGVAYATFSSDGLTRGIYRSSDRTTWQNITPTGFPSTYDRIVIGINPQNENSVYFLAVTPGYGQSCPSYLPGDTSWISFWKFTYLSGNGTGSGALWTNLSSNIPHNGTSTVDNFNAQGSYNLIVRVKPNDSNVVFIGGTNLYRSTDGFTTSNNVRQIGGYQIGTGYPSYYQYLNHHPDQHNILFLPSNPNVMISTSDGGIAKTYNCLDSIVAWTFLNNGYITTQAYTAAIDESSNNDIIVSGFQDNGTYFTNSANPSAIWTRSWGGDGSYNAISSNGNAYYLSIQNGKVYKMRIGSNGSPTAFRRIDPIGGKGYQFINPFVIDPNDTNVIYVAGGHKVWRNDSLNYIQLTNSYDSISKGWITFIDTVTTNITALAVSNSPAHTLYYGTSSRSVYKILNANTGNPSRVNITGTNLSSANVSCIAVDQHNANNLVISYSNYNVYSLFYSTNGGTTWIKGAGNLEQFASGSGNGPSIRWVSILPINGKNLFLAGTSIGLFATDTLQGLSTIWVQLGTSTIGNVVVDMIRTRESDGLVVVATHGSGLFSTHITSFSDIPTSIAKTSDPNSFLVNVNPNPSSDNILVGFYISKKSQSKLSVIDRSGKEVKIIVQKELPEGEYNFNVDVKNFPAGLYYCQLETGGKRSVRKFVVIKHAF